MPLPLNSRQAVCTGVEMYKHGIKNYGSLLVLACGYANLQYRKLIWGVWDG